MVEGKKVLELEEKKHQELRELWQKANVQFIMSQDNLRAELQELKDSSDQQKQ